MPSLDVGYNFNIFCENDFHNSLQLINNFFLTRYFIRVYTLHHHSLLSSRTEVKWCLNFVFIFVLTTCPEFFVYCFVFNAAPLSTFPEADSPYFFHSFSTFCAKKTVTYLTIWQMMTSVIYFHALSARQ